MAATSITSGKGTKNDCILVLTHELLDQEGLPIDLSSQQLAYINSRLQQNHSLTTLDLLGSYLFVCQQPTDEEGYKNAEALRNIGHQITQTLNQNNNKRIVLHELPQATEHLLYIAEGIALSNYQFLKYKLNQEEQRNALQEILIAGGDHLQTEIQKMNNLIGGTSAARNLVNEPLSYLTAEQLSKEIEMLAQEAGFEVDVFHKQKIEELGMGGLLSVNRGSMTPPTFNILEWKPQQPVNDQPFILVGKGVVYDTGGMSLKSTANAMDFMKADMGGAATVIGTLYATAKSALPVHVIGLVPATDNRPGQNAFVPGDVITMYDGSSVEVMNTDAEGRLILADALTFAKDYNPSLVIDFATLTGSAARAIGSKGLVYMGTADERIKDQLENSGRKVYERLVEFPFWEEYRTHLQSDIADLKNVGGAEAGAIVAGKFLQHFIDYPWLHFDIAGPAFLHHNDRYRGKNGTGVGVRLMHNFLAAQA